ncbi:MAG: GPR endopeptidase [Clostridia bacterium]
MQKFKYNTDMADERVDEYKVINNMSSIDGIEVTQEKYDEFKITQVNVLNENGAEAIDKKIGKYITFEMEDIKYIEDRQMIIDKLEEQLKNLIDKNKSVMIVGLGNLYVTPDALGSKVVNGIEVTRHILEFAKEMIDSNTREVSAICPGVMGNTGIQTSEIISAVSEIVKPQYIIVIDSLMSKSIKRVGSSIQISNTGITPGSGITGINNSIDSDSTGATVISLGVPMVVDMATITNDALSKIENKDDEKGERYHQIANVLDTENYIVTPKDIDELIEIMSEIISESINKAM